MKNLKEKTALNIFDTNSNLKEYDLPYSSFIGGWHIDEKVCDDLISYFKANKHRAKQGATYFKDISKTNNDVKESLDINFDTRQEHTIAPILNTYLGKLQETLLLYLEKFRHANHVEKFKAEHFNLQWYRPGGGFKKWHCERCGTHDSDRHLVFMTYLNDVPDGGTKFLYQDLELPAKKGLTVIWPSDWTHTHKGVISKEHEKYIITGWFNYT